MKKTKLLVLTAMTALLLTGCTTSSGSSAKAGSLPSGGKSVDVTTEAGQEVMQARLESATKAYQGLDLESFSATAVTSGVTATVKADATAEGVGAISLDAGIKDFGSKVELKAAKDDKNLKASLSASTTGGSLYLKGSIPGSEEGKTAKLDASLSLKGVAVNAYISGSKAYVDLSNSGNDKLVSGAQTFVNTLLSQAETSMFGALLPMLGQIEALQGIYDAEKNEFKLVDLYNTYVTDKKMAIDMGQPVAWPEFSASGEAEAEADASISAEQIGQAIQMLNQMKVKVEFKTYSGDGFGVAVSVDKEALLALASSFLPAPSQDLSYDEEPGMVEEATSPDVLGIIEEAVSKFSLSASVYFNKKGLLESAGFALDMEAGLKDASVLGDYAATFSTFTVNVTAKASEKIDLKYNGVKVSLPSFDGYKELQLAK